MHVLDVTSWCDPRFLSNKQVKWSTLAPAPGMDEINRRPKNITWPPLAQEGLKINVTWCHTLKYSQEGLKSNMMWPQILMCSEEDLTISVMWLQILKFSQEGFKINGVQSQDLNCSQWGFETNVSWSWILKGGYFNVENNAPIPLNSRNGLL